MVEGATIEGPEGLQLHTVGKSPSPYHPDNYRTEPLINHSHTLEERTGLEGGDTGERLVKESSFSCMLVNIYEESLCNAGH